ncbi:MAG: hypothetical protein K2P85_11305 [Flavobacteriaceae bacterium]|nr:hypothetical protein [Flavobacteriaceae bacterium]
MNKKVILMILDGWGKSPDPKVSAIDNANIPFVVAINDLQTAIDNQNSNNDEIPNSRAAGTGD